MKRFRVTAALFSLVVLGSSGLFAAERGRSSSRGEREAESRRENSNAQWYADPERGWIKPNERYERREERKESPKDRRSKERGKGKSGFFNY